MASDAQVHRTDTAALAGSAAEAAPHAQGRSPLSFAADGIAEAALRARHERTTEQRCDACDGPLEGEPAGRGLYMWTRGDEVRFEEPALCDDCATAIGVTALANWAIEEEEG